MLTLLSHLPSLPAQGAGCGTSDTYECVQTEEVARGHLASVVQTSVLSGLLQVYLMALWAFGSSGYLGSNFVETHCPYPGNCGN